MIGLLVVLYIITLFIWLVNIKTNALLIFFCLFLIIITTFRPGEAFAWDYDNYKYAFIYGDFKEKIEFSFVAICEISKYIYNSYYMMFFIYAFFSIIVKIYAIKTISNLFWASLLIYISNFYIVHELIQIRAGLAAAFLLLSVKFIYDRKCFLFLICNLLAFCFHYSAMVFLPFYFIKGNNINIKLWLLIIGLGYLSCLGGISIIDILNILPFDYIKEQYTVYMDFKNMGIFGDANLFNSVQLIRLFIIILILVYSSDIYQYNKYIYICAKIYSIGILFFTQFASMSIVSFRISELFYIVEIILIPCLIYVSKSHRIILTCFVILISMFMMYIRLFYEKLLVY